MLATGKAKTEKVRFLLWGSALDALFATQGRGVLHSGKLVAGERIKHLIPDSAWLKTKSPNHSLAGISDYLLTFVHIISSPPNLWRSYRECSSATVRKNPRQPRFARQRPRGCTQGGFEVLWDSKLQTSQSWRAVIDEWLWRCDAAVLVLSDAATQSRYVAYEAALLQQRWRYGLQLVPIWCPGITEQTLVERMGALKIAEIQTRIKLTNWPGVYDDIANQVHATLDPLINRNGPRHEVEKTLVDELTFGTPSEEALRAISDEYGVPSPIAGAKRDLALLLARHLLDCSAPLGPPRFSNLRSGLPTMQAAISEAIRLPRIVNLVTPFCWVSPEAAVQVAGLFSRPATETRAVGWCRWWRHAEKMYLYRGFCTRDRSRLFIVKASDVTGGSTDEILEHIRSVLAWEVCYQPAAATLKVADRIASLANDGRPVYLILPARSIDSTVLDKVLGTWPQLCVFLYAEDNDRIDLSQQFPMVTLLAPPLVPADEESALLGWGDCMRVADPNADLEAEATFL